MNNITKKYYVLAAVAVVLIIVIGLFIGNRKTPSTQTTPGSQTSTVTGVPSQPAATAPSTKSPSPVKISVPAGKTAYVTILSPKGGDSWLLNTPHKIEWDKSVPLTGSAYLVDAANGQTVGCITPSIILGQTSFSWDTQYVSASRTDASRKQINGGQYIVRVVFDKNGGEIQSPAFNIIYPYQIQNASYDVYIKNLSFNPNALSVNQGDKITFTNNDTIPYTILTFGAATSNTVKPGESFTFNTSLLLPGYSYDFYSDTYPQLKMTVTVTQIKT